MIRVKNKFKELKQKKQKAFGVFLTAGYPSLEYSKDIFKKILDAEVDFIEIGLPFSDPMADGPLIQHSSQIAIEQDTSVEECFKLVKEIRKINNDIPIILMGYYNPIHYYGNLKFIKKAVLSGIDGLIIVDLPMEEDEEFYNLSYKNNLPLIRLVTPTTDEERLKKILKNAYGFVYYVSVTGITGTKSASVNDVKDKIKVIKKITNLPVIAGFGIKNSVDAKKMSSISDGIVIGSSLVNKIEEVYKKKNGLNEIFNFLKSFK
ncbi:MAG: tryptophan synthase subunit alpha [Alphaproteobacteria bacterium]|nr:MAG: tryptophan synthase subunit alpha [Alphaproteobacteria bacterium]